MSKAILIVNALSILNLFSKKPLIYNILWKLLIYTVFILLLQSIDSFIHLVAKHHEIKAALFNIQHEFTSPIFWGTFLWFIMVFSIFIIFSEFTRVIGKDKVKQILFGSSPHQQKHP